MNVKKVTIITACYNGEKYLENYFLGLNNQRYGNIEVIFVDDGSKDHTKEICDMESKKLNKNIKFNYYCQENGGVVKAINNGLSKELGDYIIILDSDDILLEAALEEKVKFLEENLEYGMVYNDAFIVNEKDVSKVVNKLSGLRKHYSGNVYEKLLTTFFMTPGTYCIRKEAFLNAFPNKKLDEKQHGQNWQIAIEIAYRYKVGYIDKPLMKYVVRDNSLSHKQYKEGCSSQLKYIIEDEKIVNKYLQKYECSNKTKNEIRNIFQVRKFNLFYQFKMKEEGIKSYNAIDNEYRNTRLRIKYFALRYMRFHAIQAKT